MELSEQLHSPVALTSEIRRCYPLNRSWEDPRAGLEAVQWTRILPLREWNCDPSAVPPVGSGCTDRALQALHAAFNCPLRALSSCLWPDHLRNRLCTSVGSAELRHSSFLAPGSGNLPEAKHKPLSFMRIASHKSSHVNSQTSEMGLVV